MSKSNIDRFGFVLLVVALGLLGFAGYSRGQNSRINTLQFVHDFVQIAYGGRAASGDYIRVCTAHKLDSPYSESTEITFDLATSNPLVSPHPMFDPKTGRLLPTPENATLIKGDFLFDRNLQFESFWTDALDSTKNRAIHDLVEKHPEWSEADAGMALKNAGARFGPNEKDALLQTIHMEKFAKLLGALTITRTEFDTFANPDHAGDFPVLFWIVRVDAQSPSGTVRKYSFAFEPFEGKLVGIKSLAQ